MTAPGSASGDDRLVIAFDVGTTQSAVAVAYLVPDQIALVDCVNRWPSQDDGLHLERVPTAILYDEEGNLIACGAEALALAARAENRGRSWGQPEHFKMQLHSAFSPSNKRLPVDKDRKPVPLSRIYADYLAYLLGRTQEFLREAIGHDVWLQSKHRAEIVFSHPNRWGAEEQKFLEKAAIQAGLVTREGARRYLHFVEEAEAAASFALSVDVTLDLKFENGTKFVICDAGGSTVDISAYVVTNRTFGRLDVAELDVPSCLDAGGVHVDKVLGMHLYEQLYIEPDRQEDVEEIHDIVSDGLTDFQEHAKRDFRLPTDTLKVTIGGRHMNYPRTQITKGVMNIEASKADGFFNLYVKQAVEEIARRVERHQLTALLQKIIMLSGGFAQSPYFQRVVQERLGQPGRTISVVNHPTSKAVAVGALKLVVGGDRSINVIRRPRPWKVWLTNFRNGLREAFGRDSSP